jgi:hypothetical protein
MKIAVMFRPLYTGRGSLGSLNSRSFQLALIVEMPVQLPVTARGIIQSCVSVVPSAAVNNTLWRETRVPSPIQTCPVTLAVHSSYIREMYCILGRHDPWSGTSCSDVSEELNSSEMSVNYETIRRVYNLLHFILVHSPVCLIEAYICKCCYM